MFSENELSILPLLERNALTFNVYFRFSSILVTVQISTMKSWKCVPHEMAEKKINNEIIVRGLSTQGERVWLAFYHILFLPSWPFFINSTMVFAETILQFTLDLLFFSTANSVCYSNVICFFFRVAKSSLDVLLLTFTACSLRILNVYCMQQRLNCVRVGCSYYFVKKKTWMFQVLQTSQLFPYCLLSSFLFLCC